MSCASPRLHCIPPQMQQSQPLCVFAGSPGCSRQLGAAARPGTAPVEKNSASLLKGAGHPRDATIPQHAKIEDLGGDPLFFFPLDPHFCCQKLVALLETTGRGWERPWDGLHPPGILSEDVTVALYLSAEARRRCYHGHVSLPKPALSGVAMEMPAYVQPF